MSDKIVASIITGGGRGIGRAIALRLARDTAVLLVGRTESDLQSTCQEIRQHGGVAEACVADVTASAAAERAVEMARVAGWTIHNLICNAGIGKSGPTESFPKETWRQIMAVNIEGSFNFIQACLPSLLAAQQGTICLLSSISGLKGYAYTAAYTTSKHALVGLARALAQEYGKRGLVVVPVCPGFVAGEMTDRTIRGVMKRRGVSAKEATQLVARANPQRRIIPPEEVAEMVAFVCSGKVPSLSGNPLILSGGE